MAYNRFQWWKTGLEREVRPLKGKNVTLSQRIKHGEFDFPYGHLAGLDSIDQEIEKVTYSVIKQSSGRSRDSLQQDIRDAVRMKNVRRIKLELEMYEKDHDRLSRLAQDLHTEFGVNLWEDMQEKDLGDIRTVDDLYNYYKLNT